MYYYVTYSSGMQVNNGKHNKCDFCNAFFAGDPVFYSQRN